MAHYQVRSFDLLFQRLAAACHRHEPLSFGHTAIGENAMDLGNGARVAMAVHGRNFGRAPGAGVRDRRASCPWVIAWQVHEGKLLDFAEFEFPSVLRKGDWDDFGNSRV